MSPGTIIEWIALTTFDTIINRVLEEISYPDLFYWSFCLLLLGTLVFLLYHEVSAEIALRMQATEQAELHEQEKQTSAKIQKIMRNGSEAINHILVLGQYISEKMRIRGGIFQFGVQLLELHQRELDDLFHELSRHDDNVVSNTQFSTLCIKYQHFVLLIRDAGMLITYHFRDDPRYKLWDESDRIFSKYLFELSSESEFLSIRKLASLDVTGFRGSQSLREEVVKLSNTEQAVPA